MSLILLPDAAADIEHEVRYLSDNPVAMESFRTAIVTSLRLILLNNNVGRHSRTKGVREWSVPDWPFVIPYRVSGDDIEVLRIWHTSRNQPKQW